MKQELSDWGDLLCLIVENASEAQAYALHIGKVHKPMPVTDGDGSANVKCPKCDTIWPCFVVDELLAWVEII
jgi:hypothetical protein